MDAQGYGKHIQKQIQGWPIGEPVTSAAVAAGLSGAFGIDAKGAKKIANVNMKRLADRGELARVQKGLYGKVKETPFGRVRPDAGEMIAALLLRDGENTAGYITGPTALNALGLCSWVPGERHIATNHYRRRIPAGARIRVYRPAVAVDGENAPYLQAIETIAAMGKYPVDAENPGDILRGMLRRGGMDNEKLIWYARKHYGQGVLLKTIDIALGGDGN